MILQVQQQMATLAKMGRRAALTAEELSSVPEDARTYNTIGKAYVLGHLPFIPLSRIPAFIRAHHACRHFLAPKAQIIDDLVERQHAYSSQIDNLKASKAALEKALKGVEGELRELLQQSPALARQISQKAV